MQRFKALPVALVAAMTFSLGAAVVPASASSGATAPQTVTTTGVTSDLPAKQGKLTSTVHGTFGALGKVTGHFYPSSFHVKNGKVYGVGKLEVKLTRASGQVLGHAHRYAKIPLRSGSGHLGAAKSCDILDLLLGPLHLNVLGLHVDLNKVILHITAIPGAGQLLGNLLCAVAHLLDGGPSHLLKLASLLNRILSLLKL